MENAIFITNAKREAAGARFGLDTTFVLFFLAMDLGTGGLEMLTGVMSFFTMSAFITLPYFLPFDGEKPVFVPWTLCRVLIAAVGILAGSVLSAATPSLPQVVQNLPFTALIVAGIFCICWWLYGIIKIRLAV